MTDLKDYVAFTSDEVIEVLEYNQAFVDVHHNPEGDIDSVGVHTSCGEVYFLFAECGSLYKMLYFDMVIYPCAIKANLEKSDGLRRCFDVFCGGGNSRDEDWENCALRIYVDTAPEERDH